LLGQPATVDSVIPTIRNGSGRLDRKNLLTIHAVHDFPQHRSNTSLKFMSLIPARDCEGFLTVAAQSKADTQW
jgi:hypothetical protein